jgi:hypothetical protein
MKQTTTSSILVLAYLRPKETIELVKKCLLYTDSKILVTVDGAKSKTDRDMQEHMVAALGELSPRIQVILFPQNYGCRRAITKGLTIAAWELKTDVIIVLEDDCLPNRNFFDLIEEEGWRLKHQVLSISGSAPIRMRSSARFYFSNLTFIHGWAMSRNNLMKMIQSIERPYRVRLGKRVGLGARVFWTLNYLKVELDLIDTWDSHWMWASWTFREPNLVPIEPLVTNVGYASTRAPNAEAKGFETRKETNTIYVDELSDREIDRVIEKDFFGISIPNLLKWSLYILPLAALQLAKRIGRVQDDV